jgi:hypothetical protein
MRRFIDEETTIVQQYQNFNVCTGMGDLRSVIFYEQLIE